MTVCSQSVTSSISLSLMNISTDDLKSGHPSNVRSEVVHVWQAYLINNCLHVLTCDDTLLMLYSSILSEEVPL